jgi:hypothetical protein
MFSYFNQKRNCFFLFHKENNFTAGVYDKLIYSSTNDSSGEDENPWLLCPLSLPSEDAKGREDYVIDATEGRLGYFIDQEYREGNVKEEV